jgi:hypothetical protein
LLGGFLRRFTDGIEGLAEFLHGRFQSVHIFVFETSRLSLPISIPWNRFAVREDNIAAWVDGAGLQLGAGAADAEGVGAAAAGFSGRALFRPQLGAGF